MSVPHLRTVFQRFLDYKGYDAAILSNLKVVSSTPGSVKCTVPVEKENTNRLGSAHGGWLATIVDVAGSLSVASHGMDFTGVSADINISYISSAKLGETLEIDATCLKMGRRLAFTQVELKAKDKLVAIGRHTKYINEKVLQAAEKSKM